jgi:hypothetical protein
MSLKRNFPDLMEAWLQYNSDSDAPSSYWRWSLVSAVAACLERKVWLMRGSEIGWYPNMYIFLVGPPGSGKSTAGDSVIKLLREIPTIEYIAPRVNKASFFSELIGIGRRKQFIYAGRPYPHSAGFLYASEARTAFDEMYKGGGIIGELTDLFNGGIFGWSADHGEGKNTQGRGKESVMNPCVNVLACSTPDWLFMHCLNRVDAAGGFGSRILLVVSKDNLRQSTVWEKKESIKDIRLKMGLIEDLKRIHMMEGPFHVHPSFHPAYEEFISNYNKQINLNAQTNVLGAYHHRKVTQLMKLTMVIAAMRRQEMMIKGEDVRTAWEMLDAIEPDMVDLLADMEMTPEAKLRREIWNYCLHHNYSGKITKNAITESVPKQPMKMIDDAVNWLVSSGRLKPIEPFTPFRQTYAVKLEKR